MSFLRPGSEAGLFGSALMQWESESQCGTKAEWESHTYRRPVIIRTNTFALIQSHVMCKEGDSEVDP